VERTDVLIAGGGFIGGALACALADAGLKTVVIEATPPRQTLAPAFDGRASAISASSQRLLRAIGVWDLLAADAGPILEIRVTDSDSRLFLHYDHRDVGAEPFGYMVENRTLRRAIQAGLAARPSIRLVTPARIADLERTAGDIEARLDDGRRIRAALCVAAEGRMSATRDADPHFRLTRWGYGQTAIVCTVAHEKPHRAIAHEHFLPAGPFAILPLTGNRASIVWTERADLAPTMMALDDAAFLDELGRRFGDFLGPLSLIGPRWSYPLSLQFAEPMVDRRLVLAGDAAHAMHPIAGQGLNMGLRDVAALRDVLADAAAAGRDLGEDRVLERYQRSRRFDNHLMLAATDGLNWLFSNDFPPLRLARDLGLAAVNEVGPLKRLFMRHAMGLIGTLPSLMRG
jgi:2-octaprenyl-6-methoxyphenol hydroxylase